ncbi:MAG: hypothetical protein M3122_00915 [Actinomycetota bacterium]|nr:hypothetical protein [Actinomycetota bacterium]
MVTPEMRGEGLDSGRRGSLLGVIAYVLVPGERRRRAAGHFQRAGVEVLRGMGALGRLERREADGTARRERIEIE